MKLLGNSCTRGCLVYLLALGALVAVSAAGLGALGSRFGLSTPGAVVVKTGPAASGGTPAANAGPLGSFKIEVLPRSGTPTPAPASQPQQAPVEQAPPAPVEQAPPKVSAQDFSNYAPKVQAQGGEISGQASAPFYIVQGGDTLWDIARRLGTTVDALKAANNLGDTLIKPGQLLYLPGPGTLTQPAPPPVEQTEPLPALPNTGESNTP